MLEPLAHRREVILTVLPVQEVLRLRAIAAEDHLLDHHQVDLLIADKHKKTE